MNRKLFFSILMLGGSSIGAMAQNMTLQECVDKALQTNHRWIVTNDSGPQYKQTIFIHAMSTKHSWMSLFDFIFDSTIFKYP